MGTIEPIKVRTSPVFEPDPCINVLLGISAEASGARTGAETVMVGEFGIEAAFIVAPGTPPQ
jgi:hypothetical protein